MKKNRKKVKLILEASKYLLLLTAYRLPLTAYRLPLTAYRLPLLMRVRDSSGNPYVESEYFVCIYYFLLQKIETYSPTEGNAQINIQ